MSDRQFKLILNPDSNNPTHGFISIGKPLFALGAVALLAILILALHRPGQQNGLDQAQPAAAVDQLSTDGVLNDATDIQAQVLQSNTAAGSNNAAPSGSQSSASVSVDGQTVQVTGNGTASQTIQSGGNTTNVNVSVQNNSTSVSTSTKGSNTRSHSTLRINSRSTTEASD
jgi:hypothetical protein